MPKKHILPLLFCVVAAVSLANCSRHRTVGDEAKSTDPSAMVNPKCNSATVVNPDFLRSEGPDLPGAGGASGRRCPNN